MATSSESTCLHRVARHSWVSLKNSLCMVFLLVCWSIDLMMSQNMLLMCCKRSCELYKKGTIKNAYANESIDSSMMSINALSRPCGTAPAPCCVVILSQRLSSVDKTVIQSDVLNRNPPPIRCHRCLELAEQRATSVHTADLVFFNYFQQADVDCTCHVCPHC